jgi:glycosyltransferase involved in cell wall biosynthesis
MKVGFYFKNGDLAAIDARHPEKGNPGMGGRQYMNIMIAYHLARDPAFPVTSYVFSELPAKLPDEVTSVVCGSVIDAVTAAAGLGVDYFITDVSLSFDSVDQLLTIAEQEGVKLIIVLSLVPSSRILHRLNDSTAVAAVVCVEKQVLGMLWDHPVVRKSSVVPNGIAWAPFETAPVPFDARGPVVTYIGSLVPQKGFGRLARAWPKVLNQAPDAILQVIGSGALYREGAELGKWGVASERFEHEEIRPYLSDEAGRPHPSVKFLGVLGAEKVDVLRSSWIGIANPVGSTETFCISAVEIQAAGTPVIAGAKYGLFDTVQDGETGYLVNDVSELADRIVHLLKDHAAAERMAEKARLFAQGRYAFENITPRWQALLTALAAGGPVPAAEPAGPSRTWGIAFARRNAAVKRLFGMPKWWPSYLGLCDRVNSAKRSFRHTAPRLFDTVQNLRGK